jgi:hypothetical protein
MLRVFTKCSISNRLPFPGGVEIKKTHPAESTLLL